MGKGKFNIAAITALSLIVVLVVGVMVSNLRRTEHITLPPLTSATGGNEGDSLSEDALIRVEITPRTVQTAIATLQRPESYLRQVTTERFWEGGSGTAVTTVTVQDGWTRTDTTGMGNRVRHVLTDGETTYVWYDRDRTYTTLPAGDISADQEQAVPTYEDVLALDADSIAAADYRLWEDESCIYVETAADHQGSALRYWVSVDSGLLTAAEMLEDETVICRVTAQPPEAVADQMTFILPDGKNLLAQAVN